MIEGAFGPFLPLILLFVLFYFLLIRPQQVQQRRRQEMLSKLQRGDQVVTIGGIRGTIIVVTDDSVRLKVTEDVELDMNKTGIGFLREDQQE
ncbi:MAG: preprotein translocase subunit YajC [Thermaerobacterales bacterium]